MINERGTNTDLVSDRVKKGNATLINCLAMCNEGTMGLHFVEVAIVLYNLVFLATLLFNCQVYGQILQKRTQKNSKPYK